MFVIHLKNVCCVLELPDPWRGSNVLPMSQRRGIFRDSRREARATVAVRSARMETMLSRRRIQRSPQRLRDVGMRIDIVRTEENQSHMDCRENSLGLVG